MTDLLDDDGLLDLRDHGRSTDPKALVEETRRRRADMPDTNRALEAWREGRMEVRQDGCHLCGRPHRMTCKSCDRPACGQHSWVMLGVCRDCATEDRVSRWHTEPEASEQNWLEGE